MASKGIVDGIEFRHGNKLVVIGCQKHSYPINEHAETDGTRDSPCLLQESKENKVDENIPNNERSGTTQQASKENGPQDSKTSNGRSVDELARFFKRK
jgi:hypothetical protein